MVAKYRVGVVSILLLVALVLGALTADPAAAFVATGSMNVPRAYHTATRLLDGRVLITGGTGDGSNSAELYDPKTRTFSLVPSSMVADRAFHKANLLLTGQVLLTGGFDLNTAELYDPASQTFTPTSGSMTTVRAAHSATLLSDGKVLIAGGGSSSAPVASAELYDPDSQTFMPVNSPMSAVRVWHTAASLLSGSEVLIAGGGVDPGNGVINQTADRFSATSFSPTGSMSTPRIYHTATQLTALLPSSPRFGFVLLTGGSDGSPGGLGLGTAELYNPTTGVFTPTTLPMAGPRLDHTASELFAGTVLIVGGGAGDTGELQVLDSAELYDPNTDTFSPAGTMTTPRRYHAAVLLMDGTVLIAGGTTDAAASHVLSSAELYSSVGPANVWVGLKNSDDVGIRFDLRAEVYRNGTQLVGSGEIASVAGGSSGFNNAKGNVIALTPTAGSTFLSGDTLSFKLFVRNACVGSGKNSGTARLWYNDNAANSRFAVTIGSPTTDYLLDGFVLSGAPGIGPKRTIDVAAGTKCSAYKAFGPWSVTLP